MREKVFCGEQGVPRSVEIDGLDGDSLHLVAFSPPAGRVVATLRLRTSEEEARIGRVAVERSFRRQGIASRMLSAALEVAQERGCERARLAAQTNATALYEGVGFSVCSDTFEEVGIEHVWMDRPLKPPA